VRSDVLYAIWSQFEGHGIHAPIAPQDMQIELVNASELRRE